MNQLEVRKETQVALPMDNILSDLGISANELAIPKLLLMQNTSEFVGEGMFQMGDIINSLSKEKVGSLDSPVEIIPLFMQRNWVVYNVSDGQPVYMRQEPVTSANEKLPWDDIEAGVVIRRDMSLDVYCLLTKEIESGEAFPIVISFRRTSFNAGKIIATTGMKLRVLGRELFSKVISIKSMRQKSEKNVYAVLESTPSRNATSSEIEAAKIWASALKNNTHKVDSSEFEKPRSGAEDVVF